MPPLTALRTQTDFATLLKSIQALDLMRRRPGYYVTKIWLLVLAMAGCWVAFALLGHSWAQLGVAAGLGVVATQILFLSHDAAHRQIFASHRKNEWIALLLGTGLGGVSLAWWTNKHNRHHQAPNQIGKDPDIDPSVVHFYPLETPPRSALLRWAHERQGWWFFPLLVVEALNLQAQSLISLLRGRGAKRRVLELCLLVARLALVPTLTFVFLPPGLAALFVVVELAVTGVYLGTVFSVSHIGMETIPRGERLDFLSRQIRTSRNIRGGRVASGLMGGLNYQIEHHLFPSMPRPNLRYARPIIQAFCLDRGITYHEIPIHRAWLTVVRHLNRVGLAGRNPYVCPTAAFLR